MNANYRQWGPYTTREGYLFYVRHYLDGTKRSVFVHRDVVEKHLNRSLNNDEHVHHKNEDVADNRIENLEVMSQSDHSRLHKRAIEMIDIICPECQKSAALRASIVRHNRNQNKAGPFRGRSCAGRWSQRQVKES